DFIALLDRIQKEYATHRLKKRVHCILLTDGEETAVEPNQKPFFYQQLAQYMKALKGADIQFSFVGLGQEQGGIVPGLNVVSKLDKETLFEMSHLSGGALIFDNEMTLQDIIAEEMRSINMKKSTLTHKIPQQISHGALFAALFFLAAALLLPEKMEQHK
ncbi:MAG TPA: hypothetical protein VN457_05075, partial [Chlamydiales bacterium]|nr:hypothetical protein [Chlamydiales bacterium]